MIRVDDSQIFLVQIFFFSSRRRHTRFDCDWSSDVCSSDLPDRARRARPEPRPAARNGLAGASRHPDAHGGHARPAAAAEARQGRRLCRNRAGRRVPVPPPTPRAARPQAFVKLATRLFVTTSLLVAAAVGSLTIAADRMLGRHLEDEIARGLEREARLVADLLPADSLRWPEFARELGARVGQRVTLIDAKGTVRGDTEFDRASLDRLENHLLRPEVQQALSTSVGRAERLSASTNERQIYVAVAGGPAGLAVVRVSTTLTAVDAQVGAVQRAVALAGLGA